MGQLRVINFTLIFLVSLVFSIGLIPAFSDEENLQLPDWIRDNAWQWSENRIGDHNFIQAIQGLIHYDIIKNTETPQYVENTSTKDIPSWIKNNARWWNQGLISDNDFLQGIQFLISDEIIIVDMENVTEWSLSKPASPHITLDENSYSIDQDAIITLIDFDLNKNSTEAETYDLDMIKVKIDGKLIGTIEEMNPAVPVMRETGLNVPVFQNVIQFTEQIGTTQIQVGDKIEFEYSYEIDSVPKIISHTIEIVS